MNTDRTRTVFDNIDWTNVPELIHECPNTVNGASVDIDLSSPVDFINDIGKVVTNARGDLDLRGTIAWVLACILENPDVAPVGAISVENCAAAGFWVGNNIIRYNFHQLAHSAHVRVTLRGSDTIPEASLDASMHGNSDYYLAQATILWNRIRQNDGAMSGITCNRTHAARALIATANHRDTEEKHSWFTNRQTVQGSMTRKHLAVAGSHIDSFSEYMALAGHDIWHYLPDRTLRDLSYLVSGKCPNRNDIVTGDMRTDANGNTDEDRYGPLILDSCGMTYRANGPVTLENFTYLGVTHAAIAVTVVVDVGQAAVDRFPYGTLGVSSIITGIAMVSAMYQSIGTKVTVANMADLLGNLAVVGRIAKRDSISRTTIMALRDTLGTAIRLGYGYCNATPDLKEMANSYESLKNFARQDPAAVSTGATLATRVRELSADPDAVGDAIKTALAVGMNSVTAIIHHNDIDTVDDDLDELEAPTVAIYRNSNQIQDETTRRQAAATLAAL